MGGQAWTENDHAILTTAVAQGLELDEIAAQLPGRTPASIDAQTRRLGLLDDWKQAKAKRELYGTVQLEQESAGHQAPDFSLPPDEPLDLDGLLGRACKRIETFDFDADPDYARIVIESDEPIAILKAADFHFGGLDIDYHSLREHLRFLFDTPRMYMQLFGDDINMMVMHRMVGARTDIFTPEEQIDFLRSLIHESVDRHKLLSVSSGNHSDEFTERNAGFGLVKLLAERKLPYFRGLGYIDLVLRHSNGEEQVYPMAFVHKTRFSSFMNPTHGNKRMEQMHPHFWPNRPYAKEYITAHHHDPAVTMEGCLPEDRVFLIKVGTFKTNCKYSQRYFGQGRIGVPTVVYHSDRFEHVVLPTPWEAYRYMRGKDWKPCRRSSSKA